MTKPLSISELAKAVDLHRETILRLEGKGLISSTRDLNNWRRYSPETVDKIRLLYAGAAFEPQPETQQEGSQT